MAKISVVIPVLNGAEYIRECMDSIAGQTFSDLEILPVDSGSTDGTMEILEEYAARDKRIRILRSKKRSMGYQYNLGIVAAQGEYVGFCEADDYLSRSMYEKLYALAQGWELDYVRSDFDMFIDKEERIFLNYHLLAGSRTELYGQVICPARYPDLLYRDVNMWNGIYRKEFLRRHRIVLNETAGAAFQDTGFVIQTFLAAERAMYVQEDANRYRKDNLGSSVYNLKGVLNVVQEAEFADTYISRSGTADEYLRAVIFRRFCSLFFGFYGKLPPKEQFTEDVRQAVNRFAALAERQYRELPYYAAAFEGAEQSLSLDVLLRDLDAFDALRRRIDEMENNSRREFYRHVSGYPRAVIFGAGEMGTSLYALLRKNDYPGVVCFSDNNPAKWGKRLMGKEIIPPCDLAGLQDGKTVFLIAMSSRREVIKEQLLSMKIDGKYICRGAAVIPHNAMEADIRDSQAEREERNGFQK